LRSPYRRWAASWESWDVGGFKAYTLTKESLHKKHLFFLPGGAYLTQPNGFHWLFINNLAKETQFSATMVDYPKAPEHDFRKTHQIITEIFQMLSDHYHNQEFVFIGDSAGGGLALSFLQTLRDSKQTPLPSNTILISPWLDISLANPLISHYHKRDDLLSREVLLQAGISYSRGEDPHLPMLSPIYGDLSHLGNILLLVASEEILFPDCIDLAEKIKGVEGSSIELKIGEGMFHDWVIFPFPEAIQAQTQIIKFINRDA
jgi:acetyl esterase/lipase